MNTTRRNFLRFAGLAAGAIGVSGQAALSATPAFAAPSAFPPPSGSTFYGASESGLRRWRSTPARTWASTVRTTSVQLAVHGQLRSRCGFPRLGAAGVHQGARGLAHHGWRSQDTWVKNIVNGLAAIAGRCAGPSTTSPRTMSTGRA